MDVEQLDAKDATVAQAIQAAKQWAPTVAHLPFVVREVMRSLVRAPLPGAKKEALAVAVVNSVVLEGAVDAAMRPQFVEYTRGLIRVYYNLSTNKMIFGAPRPKSRGIVPGGVLPFVQEIVSSLPFGADIAIVAELVQVTMSHEVTLAELPATVREIMQVISARCSGMLLSEQMELLAVAVIATIILKNLPDSLRDGMAVAATNMIRVYYSLSKGESIFTAASGVCVCCK